jgi:crotonobetainyl-CoA:carnitine CoA-transferase CaiB-like acyl-CoA transferase
MLSSYRVLDLSDDRGLLCGHILAQLGADVVHVEPPSAEAEARSTTWLAYARGSRSVALDLDDPADRARFHELITRPTPSSNRPIRTPGKPGAWVTTS